jgi:hypothetical protein
MLVSFASLTHTEHQENSFKKRLRVKYVNLLQNEMKGKYLTLTWMDMLVSL